MPVSASTKVHQQWYCRRWLGLELMLFCLVSESCSVVSLQPHGLYSPWNSPGQNTGMGSLSLLQGIFQTQGSNLGLPHCRRILHQLSYKGSPRILEWVAYPFSSISSRPRNQTRVSCIAGGFFTNWVIREVLLPRTIPFNWLINLATLSLSWGMQNLLVIAWLLVATCGIWFPH